MLNHRSHRPTITYTPAPYEKRYDGTGTSFATHGTVDPSLSSYVNLTAASFSGSSGPGYSWNTADGQVSWIASPNMTIHSLQNLHLTVYTTVDSNTTSGKLTRTHIGIHVLVNQKTPQIPLNALDHQEVIIPNLGTENPRYEYHFNCSTYIPPHPTATPNGNA